MHKALHPGDDEDILYVSRKEGEKGLTSIQDSVDASRLRLEHYIKKRGKDWLQRPETIRTTNSNRTKINKKANMGSKTTVWTFSSENKRNLTLGNLDMAMNGKP